MARLADLCHWPGLNLQPVIASDWKLSVDPIQPWNTRISVEHRQCCDNSVKLTVGCTANPPVALLCCFGAYRLLKLFLSVQSKYLSLIGGISVDDNIRRVLSSVMTVQLSREFSFYGRGRKRAFQTLRLKSVAYGKLGSVRSLCLLHTFVFGQLCYITFDITHCLLHGFACYFHLI